jgi:hypothetical protein
MNKRPSSWLQPVKNSSNLSTLSVSRQPLPGYDQPSTSGPNSAPNIQPPTLSGVQWLDADDISAAVRPNAANTAAGSGSAAHGTLTGDETDVLLPAEKAATGDNSLDGGGNRAAQEGNVAGAGPLAIEHVDSGGNSAVDVGQPGGGGIDAALTQEDGFDAEDRGAVDHAGQLEESILLYTLLYNGYDFRRPITYCFVSLFTEKTGESLCSFSLSGHSEQSMKSS